jgi:NADH-quinone oxidoreductase subunit C
MSSADVVTILEQKFGDRIKAKKLDAIDPYIVVDPADVVAVCRYLRDDPRLRFEILNSICGVDYLELDPKKAPKAGYEPHLEVVYHLSSFSNRPNDRILRFTVKVLLPR